MSGGSDDYGLGIAVAADGSVYTTGSFQGTVDFHPGPGVCNLAGVGNRESFVSKLDSAGDYVWARSTRSLDGIQWAEGSGIALAPDGSVYTSGMLWGTVDFDPENSYADDRDILTSAGGWDIVVHKLDSAGNFVWAHSMGGETYDFGLGIAVATDGSVYTTGYFTGTVDFNPGTGTSNLTSTGGQDIFVSKLDSGGDFLWAGSMGGASVDQGSRIAVTPEGSVHITGQFYGTSDFDPGDDTFNLASTGGYDIFLAKLKTIDTGVPTSQVGPLPAQTFSSCVLVSWTGQDDAGGAGVASYDVYVSDNGEPFELWLDDTQDTSATFHGSGRHTYAFYSVAKDYVGHSELPPETPDAQTTVYATVADRHIFYNNSYFDGFDPAPGVSDDDAIAPDPDSASDSALGKTALLPAQTATKVNYTSYSHGINGIMVDVDGLGEPDQVSTADFDFHVSNRNNSPENNVHDPSAWGVTPVPTISVREKRREGHSPFHRISLVWTDGDIQRQWLQVTVKANGRTGLDADDVFYFGNAVGESLDAAAFTFVDGTDFAGARDNTHDSDGRAPMDDRFDYNRDSLVDGADLAIARDNHTNFLTCLTLFTAPRLGRSPSSSRSNSSSSPTAQLSEVLSLADHELDASVAISGSDRPMHFLVDHSYLRPTTRQPVDLPQQRTEDFDPVTVSAVFQNQEPDDGAYASDSTLQRTGDRWLNAVDDLFENDDNDLLTW